jgi:membrane-bound serine protease (ClpP class)
VAGGERTLATISAPRREIGMSWIETILHMLGDPSIATLLLSLGSLGIYFELATPGVGVSGVAGIICLGLGMYGLSILPVNIVGAGLLLVSFVMFAVDIFATNHGALTAGGIAAFVVGALLLIDADAAPGVAVSKGIIFGIALGLAVVMALIMMLMTRMRHLPAISGINTSMIGEAATVRSPLAPQGTVWTQGALWQARSADLLEVGDEAEIIAVEGLTLVVRRRALSAALEAPKRGNGGM